MAFRIKPGESVAKCVRRLARVQIDKAYKGLVGRSGERREEVIHDARKRFKRIRALLRLAGDGLGAKLAAREGERFRDAGRPLSEVRDADVLVQTFNGLVERFGDQGCPDVIERARAVLLRRKQDVCRRVLAEEDALFRVAEILEGIRPEVKRWDVSGGWKALERGIGRIYEGSVQAFREASKEPTDETLHEWRKRTKDLWYALDILTPIRPAYLGGRAGQARKLTDILGDDHDLAVLLSSISNVDCGAAATAIVPLILHRRAELRRDAFVLGPALLHETPEEFVARLRAFWRAWRAEVEAARFE